MMHTPSNIIMRQATAANAALLRELCITTFTATYAAHNTPEDMQQYINEHFADDILLQELNDEANTYFIADVNGVAAGYCKLRTNRPETDCNAVYPIELERIYALQGYQGIGLGHALVRQAVQHATENGFDMLWLGVWEENEKAIAFYKRNGFEVFGEHIFMLGSDPQRDWLMKVDLNQ